MFSVGDVVDFQRWWEGKPMPGPDWLVTGKIIELEWKVRGVLLDGTIEKTNPSWGGCPSKWAAGTEVNQLMHYVPAVGDIVPYEVLGEIVLNTSLDWFKSEDPSKQWVWKCRSDRMRVIRCDLSYKIHPLQPPSDTVIILLV